MDYRNIFSKKIKQERRGVAPIIATLLMVAIAVVGGILIFVFAQGFFSGTSDIAPSGTESIALTGYDAREITSVRTSTNVAITSAQATTTTEVAAGDPIAIYVTNKGANVITINTVEVEGNSHSFAASGVLNTASTFALVSNSAGTTTGDAEIEGGEALTIVVDYHASGSALDNGRITSVKVITTNGGEFTFPVKIGQRET